MKIFFFYFVSETLKYLASRKVFFFCLFQGERKNNPGVHVRNINNHFSQLNYGLYTLMRGGGAQRAATATAQLKSRLQHKIK